MRKDLPVRWDTEAVNSLRDIYDYIKVDSKTAATKVRKGLLSFARTLGDFPEKYSVEPYLEDEFNNYRSVTKWSYKIIFEVTHNEIIVVMIFHTSQNPNKIASHR